MQVHFQFIHDYILACFYWKQKLQHACIVPGDPGSAGERSCWSTAELSLGPRTARSLWVQTNNYKFHTFHSVHFHPSLSPRLPFWFSEGLVLRVWFRDYCSRGAQYRCYWHVYILGFVADWQLQTMEPVHMLKLSLPYPIGVDAWTRTVSKDISLELNLLCECALLSCRCPCHPDSPSRVAALHTISPSRSQKRREESPVNRLPFQRTK